ncbi:ribonuclease HII [Sedimenticola sp.]|uniref:ribonuclease HII n=1 Tax=Sedimenticola sp. TaxID=1940285 RepID=UPI003D1122AE
MQPHSWVAGIDEAGRGPLAGPVVAAAVILPAEYSLPGLNDSKKLTEKRREKLEPLIQEQAVSWAIGRAEPQEIDQLNILQATLLAMRRAYEGLSRKPDFILVDGNQWPQIDCPGRTVVGGDTLEPSISAASVLAKVARDREMLALHDVYPQYGFDRHKGYPTKTHLEAISAHGVTPTHRRSFGPVRKAAGSRPVTG